MRKLLYILILILGIYGQDSVSVSNLSTSATLADGDYFLVDQSDSTRNVTWLTMKTLNRTYMLSQVNTWSQGQTFSSTVGITGNLTSNGTNTFSGLNTFNNQAFFNDSVKIDGYTFLDTALVVASLSKSGTTGLGLARNATIAELLAGGTSRTMLYSPSAGIIPFKYEVLGTVFLDTLASRDWVRSNFTDTSGTSITKLSGIPTHDTLRAVTVNGLVDYSISGRLALPYQNAAFTEGQLKFDYNNIDEPLLFLDWIDETASDQTDTIATREWATNNLSLTESDPVWTSDSSTYLSKYDAGVTYTPQSITLTLSGTANEVEITGGTQSLAANRTWTIGLPNSVTLTNDINVGGIVNQTGVGMQNEFASSINLASGLKLRLNNSDWLTPTNLYLGSGSTSASITTPNGLGLFLTIGSRIWIDNDADEILPLRTYEENLGSIHKRFLTLHAAELRVQNLVAENITSTIGGRVFIAPTTELIDTVTTGLSYIRVKHNNLSSGDRVVLENNGNLEWMAITSSASSWFTGYQYSVTRNLDGTGANAWSKGDAVVNTGTTGDGFIDLYAQQGILGSSTGPTIVGNVRYGTTYNHFNEHWAIGNLNGVYGYATNTYGVGLGRYASGINNVVIDATNGIRFRNYTTTIGSWNGSTITLGEVASNKSNVMIDADGMYFRRNTTNVITIDGTTAKISSAIINSGTYKTVSTDIGVTMTAGFLYVKSYGDSTRLSERGISRNGLLVNNHLEVNGKVISDNNFIPYVQIGGSNTSRTITLSLADADSTVQTKSGLIRFWISTTSDPSGSDPGISTYLLNNFTETLGRLISPTTFSYTSLMSGATNTSGVFRITATGLSGGAERTLYVHADINGQIYTQSFTLKENTPL